MRRFARVLPFFILVWIAGPRPADAADYQGQGFSVHVPDGYKTYALTGPLRRALQAHAERCTPLEADPHFEAFLKGPALSPEGLLVVLRGQATDKVRAANIDLIERRVAVVAQSGSKLTVSTERRALASGQQGLEVRFQNASSTGMPAQEVQMIYVPGVDGEVLVAMWQGRDAKSAVWASLLGSLRMEPRASRLERLVLWSVLGLIALVLLLLVVRQILQTPRRGTVDFGEAPPADNASATGIRMTHGQPEGPRPMAPPGASGAHTPAASTPGQRRGAPEGLPGLKSTLG